MDGFEIDENALDQMVALERSVHPEKTCVELAEKTLEDAAPAAAIMLVQLALRGSSESVRLSATKYLLDRTLGKSGNGPTKLSVVDELINEVFEVKS